MSAMPPPPVPPEIDLRGLGWMPFLGDRLFASVTWIAASDAGKIAALRLWWHSFSREIPASSLPDDDQLLASYANLTMRNWTKRRTEIMRGWVQCSDGRWYHPVVAELALDAWYKRQQHNAKRENDRDRLRKWRAAQRESAITNLPHETPPTRVSTALRHTPETQMKRIETGQDRTETGFPPFIPPFTKRVSNRGNGHAKPSAIDNLLLGAAQAVNAIEQQDKLASNRNIGHTPPTTLLDPKR